jgi:hypothetical protein
VSSDPHNSRHPPDSYDCRAPNWSPFSKTGQVEDGVAAVHMNGDESRRCNESTSPNTVEYNSGDSWEKT